MRIQGTWHIGGKSYADLDHEVFYEPDEHGVYTVFYEGQEIGKVKRSDRYGKSVRWQIVGGSHRVYHSTRKEASAILLLKHLFKFD